MITEFDKDPTAALDYTFDWSDWLAVSETIIGHSVTVQDGIVLGTHANNDTAVTVWLSGGTVDNQYNVVCTITTNQGRIDSRKITIIVKNR